VAANFPAALMEKMLDFWGSPCTVMFIMNRKTSHREQLQKALEHIAKSFQDEKLTADYEAIQKEKSMSKKIEKAQEFWNRHGNKMVKRINNNDYYLYNHKDDQAIKGYYDMI